MKTQAVKGMLWTACAALFATTVIADDGKQDKPRPTAEQQAEMDAYVQAGTPGAPHAALALAAGSYDVKLKSWYEAGGEPVEETGTATRQMILGGRVLVESLDASMMGAPFTGHGMSGYDNVSGKYWSTWMDNFSTGLMVSHGTCNAMGACEFSGSWNDPIKKGPVTARMTSRWSSLKTQVFEMFGPGKDGREMKMMEIIYTKK